ncbi:MAG: hypothetical protein RR998_08210 [Oscillospiraceae bacterium]
MIRDQYIKMNDGITPSPALVGETITKINDSKFEERKPKPTFFKPLVTAAVIAIVIFFSLPVFAANVPEVYELLYRVAPSVAQFFKPVEMSDTCNGIRLFVSAIYVRKNKIDVLLSITDKNQNRVDETIDLFDGYWMESKGNSIMNDKLVDFDETTRTATFMLTFTDADVDKLEGEKVSFGLSSFYCGGSSQNERPTGLDLNNFSDDVDTVARQLRSWYFEDETVTTDFNDDGTFNGAVGRTLVPFKKPVLTVIQGIDISAAGYVDGKFKIQTHTAADKHGNVWIKLLDSDGNAVDFDYERKFSIPETAPAGEGEDYDEYVFDIPKEKIGEHSLSIGYSLTGERVEGPWQVTFSLEDFRSSNSAG